MYSSHDLFFFHSVVFCCVCTGQRVVSGGGDGVVNVWDLETGNVTATLTGHTQEVVRYVHCYCHNVAHTRLIKTHMPTHSLFRSACSVTMIY